MSALSFADCVNTNVALYSNTTESPQKTFYMLIYACWSPICVAGPSVLYSGVVPSQAHMGTDKNTDTYRDIYQERILRKNEVSVWNKLKLLSTRLVVRNEQWRKRRD